MTFETLMRKVNTLLEQANAVNKAARELAGQSNVPYEPLKPLVNVTQNDELFKALLTADHEGNKPDLTEAFPSQSASVQ